MPIFKLKMRIRCRPWGNSSIILKNLATFFTYLVTFLADLVAGSVQAGARSG